jgi:transposase
VQQGCQTGCPWRNRPKEFPEWNAVYPFCFRARAKGVRDAVLAHLVGRRRGERAGSRAPHTGSRTRRAPRRPIGRFCGDAGCRRSFEEDVRERLGVDISARIKPGWEVLPKRRAVERTFSWLNPSRRLSKDVEIKTANAETRVQISHLHTLLRRI